MGEERDNYIIEFYEDIKPSFFRNVEVDAGTTISAFAPSSTETFILNKTPNLTPIYLDRKTVLLENEGQNLAPLADSDFVHRVLLNTHFEVPYDPGIGAAGAVDNEDNWAIPYCDRSFFASHNMNGQGVRVAVLDSGIDTSHPSLANLNFGGFLTFARKDGAATIAKPSDSQWHGTHVSAILCGEDDGKLRGFAPHCELFVGQVLHNWSGSVASIKAGLIWVRDEVKPDILNLSLGWPGIHDEWVPELQEITENGTIVCVASGNEFESSNKHRSPANYVIPGLLSVGAISNDGMIWERSGGGSFVWSDQSLLAGRAANIPDISAPGVDIVSASGDGSDYRIESGTSMASPLVAGILAALLSHPSIDASQAVKILEDSLIDEGAPGFDIRYGKGSISGASLKHSINEHLATT